MKKLLISLFFFGWSFSVEKSVTNAATDATNIFNSVVSNYNYSARIWYQPEGSVLIPYIGTNKVTTEVLGLYLKNHPNKEVQRTYKLGTDKMIAGAATSLPALLLYVGGTGGIIGYAISCAASSTQPTIASGIAFSSIFGTAFLLTIITSGFNNDGPKVINRAIEINNSKVKANWMVSLVPTSPYLGFSIQF